MSPKAGPKDTVNYFYAHTSPPSRSHGFTLLEIMLVIVIMGLAVGVVMFNSVGQSKLQELEKQTKRFQVVFDMAADFAVLNQQQLGVYIDRNKRSYYFMHLDEEQKWRRLEGDKVFSEYQLPDAFSFELELDDLPWQEDESLFDQGVFDEQLSFSEDDIKIGEEEEKLPPPPQIFILSSGDITPFSLSFIFEPDFGSEEPVYFRVNGEDTPPLTREGPLDSL